MADLKTNYVDDVLDSSKNQLRKYQQIQNDDGTVSFVDVTEYTTTGTSFGAKDINDTNAAVNELNESLADIRTWKVLVNSVPSTTVTEWNLPTTDWKELEIRIGYSNDNNYCELRVVKAEIPSTGTQFRRGGYYYDSQNRMHVGIAFTKTKIGVSDFNYIAGGTSKNEYSTTIYYR